MTHQRRKCKQCDIYIESKRGRQFCNNCAKERDGLSRLGAIRKYRNTSKGRKKSAECRRRYAKRYPKKIKREKKLRKERLRERALKELGGKCGRCGYNEFKVSLDIHHKDPTQKKRSGDPDWMKVSFKDWDSLVLFCRNCHHALHKQRLSYP